MADDDDPSDSDLKTTWETVRSAWSTTGGAKFLRSIYPRLALLLTAICWRLWVFSSAWVDLALTILPALLGFALGGYAIFTALGDVRLRKLMVGEEGEADYLTEASAIFVQFLLVQLGSLGWALIAKYGWLPLPASGVIGAICEVFRTGYHLLGTWTFFYSLTMAIAVVLNVFRLVGMSAFLMRGDATKQRDVAQREKARLIEERAGLSPPLRRNPDEEARGAAEAETEVNVESESDPTGQRRRN